MGHIALLQQTKVAKNRQIVSVLRVEYNQDMNMEQPELGGKRIDDKDLARKMAYSGDSHRTFAAQNRERAEALESPKTLKGKIIKWLEGRGTEDQAKRLRLVADADDKTADWHEENVIFNHKLQEETKDLNDDQIENLVDEAFQELIDVEKQITAYYDKPEAHPGINIEKLKNYEERIKQRWIALSKMMIFRQSINQARSRK